MPPKTADKKDVIEKDPSCKVKNTFLEFGDEDEAGYWKGRTRSDPLEGLPVKHSPLVVASKSPVVSPMLQPVDERMQAMPIDEVQFEMLEEVAEPHELSSAPAPPGVGRPVAADGVVQHVAQSPGGLGREEPAYVVPATPSPFLRSAFPPSTVPPLDPLDTFGYNGLHDGMGGLPPAFEQEGELGVEDGYAVQGMDMEGMPFTGMVFMPEMCDPSYGQYMGYVWGAQPMDMDGEGGVCMGGGMILEDGSMQTPQDADGSMQAPQDAQGRERSAEGRSGGSAAERPAGGDGAAERAAKDGGRSRLRAGAAREEEKTDRRGGASGGGDRDREARDRDRERDRVAAAGEQGGALQRQQQQQQQQQQQEERASKAAPRTEGREENCRPTEYTTVMLRNIPNKYTREMLVKQLSLSFGGEFDFIYLPIDFKNKCNVGYSFINFRTQEACERFVAQFHGVDVRKCLPGLNSKKVVEVTPARVQGLMENVRRLRNSPVMNQLKDHPEWMPLVFNERGDEEPFPMPEQPLPPVKPRGRNRESHSRADAGA